MMCGLLAEVADMFYKLKKIVNAITKPIQRTIITTTRIIWKKNLLFCDSPGFIFQFISL
jgi:hypothetical protein